MRLSSHIPSQRSRTRFLLKQILKAVSRSFYLSLFILPRRIRQQTSLAYLFCRVADTIADTALFPASERRQILEIFRRQFLLSSPSLADLAHIEASLLRPPDATQSEYLLCKHLSDCFLILQECTPVDRKLICDLVYTLTQGMQMDLTHFSTTPRATLQALPDFAALQQYTYYVAGVVGEFWTKLHNIHLYNLPDKTYHHACILSISFGQGLQLTNILKDLGKDLAIGRCYVPRELLARLNITLPELTQSGALLRLRPLLFQLIHYTLYCLDQGCQYILMLPPWALRSRLSGMWPLLFALQTLAVIWSTEYLLSPQAQVKISRRSVYITMVLSFGCLIAPVLFRKYYIHLRRHLTKLLALYQDKKAELVSLSGHMASEHSIE
ncbi:MAG: phytoene/squalene synthase family protein [Candidatus Tectimicrobiota bacterium]